MPQAADQEAGRQIIAGDAAVLARRYAGALFELAHEQKQIDDVAADLRLLRGLLEDSPEFSSIAHDPRLTREELVKAMQAVTASAKLTALTGNFLGVLARNRRLSVLGGVVQAFLDELAERRGEFTADIRTAYALSSAQQEQLALKLRELAGGKVHMTVREDKSLLGGLTVKMGSRLIDASIKTKLERLARQLKQPQSQTTLTPQKGAA